MSDTSPITAQSVDAVVVQAAATSFTPKAVDTHKPWLLWTGVVGAIFSLIALLSLVLLGQRLLAVESAQQAQLEQQFQQRQAVQVMTQALEATQQAQSQRLQAVTEGVDALNAQWLEWQQAKPNRWQQTDALVVRVLLAQLRGVAMINADPRQLAAFVQAWQAQLQQGGVAEDHALTRALSQELSALAMDVPSWRSEQAHWQALQQQLAVTQDGFQSMPASRVALSDDSVELSWWQRLTALIHITPVQQDKDQAAQAVRARALWTTQADMAMLMLRYGLLTNQPLLVQEHSQQLQRLLQQQAPALLLQWQSQLLVWQQWEGLPIPKWHYLETYLAAQDSLLP